MDGIDAFLAHAIVDPTAAAAGGSSEARAAKALGLQILGLVGERPSTRTWRARKQDGKLVGLVVLADTATDAERERFAAVADRLHAAGAVPGVVRVHAVSPSHDALVVDLWTTGCATDLPTLNWPPRRRLEFVRRVTQGLDALHRAGVVHGCLCADNVLLDDDLQPVLAEAGIVSVRALLERRADAARYVAFAAPEVKNGAEPDPRSDIWSAGCLLELLVGERDLPQVAEIVRRCMAPTPHVRYGSAAELAAAIDAVVATLPTGDRVSRVGVGPDSVRERSSIARSQPGRRPAAGATPARPARIPAIAGALALVVLALGGLLVGPPSALAHGLFGLMALTGAAVATWGLRRPKPSRLLQRRGPAARESAKDARRGPSSADRRGPSDKGPRG